MRYMMLATQYLYISRINKHSAPTGAAGNAKRPTINYCQNKRLYFKTQSKHIVE